MANRRIRELETKLANTSASEFEVTGVSYPANEMVRFHVDRQYSDGVNINWRERLICPKTKLNNRLRAAYQFFDTELNYYPDDRVYITEHVTPFFEFLSDRIPNLVGSEYFGEDRRSGQMVNGIRHEDMTRLSFSDEQFDIFMSFECLEHVPNFQAAISEAYRCLKPGGRFLGTFPFSPTHYDNTIRATLSSEGRIIHFLEPEYHGNPLSEEGSLCFTVFGWEILDILRSVGFRDAYAIVYWSDLFGYLGGEQFLFIANK